MDEVKLDSELCLRLGFGSNDGVASRVRGMGCEVESRLD
jgi:hypothetical protein